MKTIFLLPSLCIPIIGMAHGVPESIIKSMTDASAFDYMYFGTTHMLTGYDHILFLIGIVFFLSNYIDILKFITTFTIAHCISLIFSTIYGITTNPYLVDTVIAFSVIYKGFENLDGFKKCFSTKAPNLVLMVFIFGLIHGFGLSTKLQEVAVATSVNLSVLQILSFNVGVEFGQIAVLILVFLIIKMIKAEQFDRIAKFSNWALVFAGTILLIFQLHGYFTDHSHQHTKYIEAEELHNEQHKHGDEHEHVHPRTH